MESRVPQARRHLFPLLLLALSTAPLPALAAGWLDTGDLRARHTLQKAADRGERNWPVTTWPAPRPADDSEIDAASLTVGQHAARSAPLFQGFGPRQREAISSRAALSLESPHVLLRASLEQTHTQDWDNETTRWDESYVALRGANLIAGAGTISRWWGPGWQNSLILSNNARPIPAAWLTRDQPHAPEHRWLRWTGPWQFVLLAGQLEHRRVIPETKFLGARLSLRPHPALELGLSRTAQWGGEGRPQTFDSLVDLMLGRDNVGSSGITDDNEPGNQLAGIDWRLGWQSGEETLAVYGQAIGEDEAGGMPSRWLMLFGMEGTASAFRGEQRWFVELADTTINGLVGDERFNATYNHGTYETGYRYRGPVIGAAIGGDSRQLTFGLMHFAHEGQQLTFDISRIDQNRDGNRPPLQRGQLATLDAPAGRRLFSHTRLGWSMPLAERARIGVDAWYSSVPLPSSADPRDDYHDTGALLYWQITL